MARGRKAVKSVETLIAEKQTEIETIKANLETAKTELEALLKQKEQSDLSKLSDLLKSKGITVEEAIQKFEK